MITQERIDEIAAEAVVQAVRELLDDRMCIGEILADNADMDHASEAEFEAECDRLEAAIRLHLPGDDEEDDDAAPDIHCTICGGIVLCTDGDWWHEKDTQDLDHDASPPDEPGQQ